MHDCYNDESLVIEDYILPECTELNPWSPIDENMPTNKHRFIHAIDTTQIGMFDGRYWANVDGDILASDPSHWMSLPESPK